MEHLDFICAQRWEFFKRGLSTLISVSHRYSSKRRTCGSLRACDVSTGTLALVVGVCAHALRAPP